MQYLWEGTRNEGGNDKSLLKYFSTVHHVKVRTCIIFDEKIESSASACCRRYTRFCDVSCSDANSAEKSAIYLVDIVDKVVIIKALN